DGQAGGNDAEKRNLGERTAARMGLREEPARLAFEPAKRALFGEGIKVALNAKRARQPEVCLDFADGRRDTMLAVMGMDEIEHLLLAVGERFAHSVQVNTFFRKSNAKSEKC